MNSFRQDEEILRGTVHKIIVQKTSGWGVLSVIESETKTTEQLCGFFNERPLTGTTVSAAGTWKSLSLFGRQFIATSIEFDLPTDAIALAKYITDTTPGIGLVTAKKIVTAFGALSRTALSDEKRLIDHAGLTPRQAQIITTTWKKHTTKREIEIALHELGLTPSQRRKAIVLFGDRIPEILRTNPFELRCIPGVGFQIADAAAIKHNLSLHAPHRHDAAIVYSLEKRLNHGHTVTTMNQIIEQTNTILYPTTCISKTNIDRAVKNGHIIERPTQTGNLYLLPEIDRYERSIVRDIERIQSINRQTITLPSIDEIGKKYHFVPDESQYLAIRLALEHKICIITGGPGTGKTTILKVIIALLHDLYAQDVTIIAPTAQAAKRASAATSHSATTIHRLLGIARSAEGYTFIHRRTNMLKIDNNVLVLEEASMVDVTLMSAIVCAVPTSSPIIILGDRFQIRSIGAGNVFADLIAGGIPTAHLTKIHRTLEGSQIPLTAKQILAGKPPKLTSRGEVRGITASDPQTVITCLKELLKDTKNLEDIGILSPMRTGKMGTDWLNMKIQQALNARSFNKRALPSGNTIVDPDGNPVEEKLAVGDRVMQTIENNYEMDVFNGDTFRVTAICAPAETARWIKLRRCDDNKEFQLQFEEIRNIRLAYAYTYHKCQGNQYQHVLLVVVPEHKRMLNRFLLNTGWTRAMKTLTVIGRANAIDLACRDAGGILTRDTGLEELLRRRQLAA